MAVVRHERFDALGLDAHVAQKALRALLPVENPGLLGVRVGLRETVGRQKDIVVSGLRKGKRIEKSGRCFLRALKKAQLDVYS
jgi:hypothetical protein